MSRHAFESEFLYGLHDPGGEWIMREAGCKGWVLFTEEIGFDPNDQGSSDRYVPLSDEGFGVIVRLNRGYYPNGTIPHSSAYEKFAQRCANFVRNSRGANMWIIGNEMNYVAERPGVEIDWSRGLSAPSEADPTTRGPEPAPRPPTPQAPSPQPPPSAREMRDMFSLMAPRTRSLRLLVQPGEPITPDRYARCYTLCREAIKAQPGHSDDLVLIGSVAPWNVNTTYDGNPSGDWVNYFRDILTHLGPAGCDGITVHTYTDGYDVGFIDQDHFMGNPSFSHRRYHFRTYIDFLEAIPANMRHLPVYITETDQNLTWEDRPGSEWVQHAYAEIDRWNRQPSHQQVRAMLLYRWPKVPGDRWWIEGKGAVIEDFRRAIEQRYRWNPEVEGEPTPPPAAKFKPGQEVFATGTVNVRRSPGHLNKPADDVLGQTAAGTPVTITGPAVKADGLTWWPVRTAVAAEGWMAEATAAGNVLLRA